VAAGAGASELIWRWPGHTQQPQCDAENLHVIYPGRMSWRLRTSFGEELVVVRDWDAVGEDDARRVPPLFVRLELRDWLVGRYGLDRATVMDMYRELRGDAMAARLEHGDDGDILCYVLPDLEEAFEQGSLVAFKLPRAEMSNGLLRADEPAPETSAEDSTLAPFGLVLTDNLSGEPLGGVALIVRTSAGEEKKVETDSSGSIRLPNLPAGHCEVTSDTAGARAERSYVVTGGPGARRDAAQGDEEKPRTQPTVHVVGVVSHRVATGDTPESIAKKWNTTWAEIALFNWGTMDPSELEERYREELGCTKKTEDGKHYRFDDADEPGIVLVPHPWRARFEVGPTHRLGAEPLRPIFISLENEFGLALPGAAYRLRDANGQEHAGRLGRSGIARVTGVPEGAFGVSYPDQVDVLARSLAASVRRGFEEQATGPLFHLLGQSNDVVERAKGVYAEHFNDLSGKGLEADIDQVVTDPEARAPLLYFCALAGLRVEGVDEVVLSTPPLLTPGW
jgi:hypothetical protein